MVIMNFLSQRASVKELITFYGDLFDKLQENFKALKAQEDKRETLKKEEEEREKEIILASGKNVSVEMMKRRRQQEIEQAKMYDRLNVQLSI